TRGDATTTGERRCDDTRRLRRLPDPRPSTVRTDEAKEMCPDLSPIVVEIDRRNPHSMTVHHVLKIQLALDGRVQEHALNNRRGVGCCRSIAEVREELVEVFGMKAIPSVPGLQ